MVIGATNRPTLLDPRCCGPADSTNWFTFPSLTRTGRAKILEIQTAKMPLGDDVDLAQLAGKTDRYTGADLSDLVRRAGLAAIRENLDAGTVTAAHFDEALQDSRASVTVETEREYERCARR